MDLINELCLNNQNEERLHELMTDENVLYSDDSNVTPLM
jgi:hypothetical protein